MTTPIVHQFEFSHFNDKVRWALDFKGIAHQRKSYLPGPHSPKMRKLSGQSQTPVVEFDAGDVVSGSASIIDRLEGMHPSPNLYPQDPSEREAALAIQKRYDTEVGPASRTVFFTQLVREAGYMARMFGRKASKPAQFMYAATFPLVRPMVSKVNGVADPANVERAFALVDATLDEIAQVADQGGYFVGSSFSIADLSAAALLAPLAGVAHYDMARPEPVPAGIAELLARYKDHPGIAWVNQMYAQHRPTQSAAA